VFTAADVMTDAATVVPAHARVAAVLAALAELGDTTALVVDDRGGLTGVVTAADLRGAGGEVGTHVRPSAAQVAPTDPLADLLAAVAGELPVVVVDDAGRPQGIVSAAAVLAALANSPADAPPPDPAPVAIPGAPELAGGRRG
jgi:CBS-domain-containing membrane protein